MIEIRSEEPQDIEAIRDVNRRAFGQEQEGRIVDALRANGGALLSLVATQQAQVVGHVMYSPARIGSVDGAALGPMAVVPEEQGHGIGTKLVEGGNDQLARSGCPFIVVVGHPKFYRRFGFRPARLHEITCEWELPDDVFMVLSLDDVQMARAVGAAVYRPEFNTVE
jgi:putative acetyltransferase